MNGCHNRAPLAQTARVQDGWTEDGRRNMVEIPVPMEKGCQYRKTELGQADPRCEGCAERGKA